MKLRVQVDKRNSTSEGFPISKIVNEDGTALATFDVQSTELPSRRSRTSLPPIFFSLRVPSTLQTS